MKMENMQHQPDILYERRSNAVLKQMKTGMFTAHPGQKVSTKVCYDKSLYPGTTYCNKANN